jgi:hypothetical protein
MYASPGRHDKQRRDAEGGMNSIAVAFVTASMLCAVNSPASEASPLGTTIPREFQGRWMIAAEQCRYGNEGWEYIANLKVQNIEGEGSVVSVRRTGAHEIEVDLTWRQSAASAKDKEDWRRIHRFAVSGDGRTLTETIASKTVVRILCE